MSLLRQYARLDPHVIRFIERMVSWAGLDREETERILDGVADVPALAAAFHAEGDLWNARAREAQAKGRAVTARDFGFFAFGCFRIADFCYSKDGSGRLDAYHSAVSAFDAAIPGFGQAYEPVHLELEGAGLAGYMVLPSKVAGPMPAVVIIHGADGNKEDHFRGSVMPAVERGMAALIMDGPGQGGALRCSRIPARPDSERLAGICFDFLARDARIDSARIGIVGTSFGGYYATRALARDPRFKAGLAISGLYDAAAGLWEPYAPIRSQLQYNLGAATPEEARAKLAAFTLAGLLADARRPLAIFHGEKDPLIPPEQARRIAAEWGGPCDLEIVPGGMHNCHNVAFEVTPRMWDWLEAALRS